MITPSFQIEHPAPAGPPVVGATNAAANPAIGSRPVVPAPGPGAWRDYYVLDNGQEPADCHMVIQWKAPITIGMQLPKAATVYCKGDCNPPYSSSNICGISSIENPTPGIRTVDSCTCQVPPLQNLRGHRQKHKESIKSKKQIESKRRRAK